MVRNETAAGLFQARNPRTLGRSKRGWILLTIGVTVLALTGCNRCRLFPQALVVDPLLAGVPDADLILEPDETVAVEPSWQKRSVALTTGPLCTATFVETGGAANLTGPAGASYTISDGVANYGSILSLSPRSCASGGAGCYLMSVSAATRPVQHWDAAFTETLHGTVMAGKVWTLHVGDSFTDVPRSGSNYRKIETLLHKGIVSGCTRTEYCPGEIVSRADAAMFIARAAVGGDANVPVSGSVGTSNYSCMAGGSSLFEDIAPTDPGCRHVHYLATQNLSLACTTSHFCPSTNVDRDAMAGFVAQAIVRPGGDAAVPETYGPDPKTGFSYSCDAANSDLHFSDVPATDPFCKHVHFLWAKGIVSGCSETEYCPTVDITRDSMAEFLVNGFALQLYDVAGPLALPPLPVVIASLFTLPPCRAIDTRLADGPLGGPVLDAGATRIFEMMGQCGIPSTATALSVNVTVTQTAAAGDVRIFSVGLLNPTVSTISYGANQTRANNAVVQLGTDGDLQVVVDQPTGTVQLIVDVNGYFE